MLNLRLLLIYLDSSEVKDAGIKKLLEKKWPMLAVLVLSKIYLIDSTKQNYIGGYTLICQGRMAKLNIAMAAFVILNIAGNQIKDYGIHQILIKF